MQYRNFIVMILEYSDASQPNSVCLRADVSYFLCCTRATKEIGDVCTQAKFGL